MGRSKNDFGHFPPPLPRTNWLICIIEGKQKSRNLVLQMPKEIGSPSCGEPVLRIALDDLFDELARDHEGDALLREYGPFIVCWSPKRDVRP